MSLENFEIISEIEVGLGNRGIGITEDGSKLVVAVKSTNDLAVIDLKTNKVSKNFYWENPEMVRVGMEAFVTFEPAAIGGPPQNLVQTKQRLWIRKERKKRKKKQKSLSSTFLLETK